MNTLSDVLHFAVDGKLEQIRLGSLPNLLHEWQWQVNLGERWFRPAGWDECYPTIDAHAEHPVMGDLVGQAPETTWLDGSVEQTWRNESYTAQRRFALVTPLRLEMSFCVHNRRYEEIEFLWASHALFSVQQLAAAGWQGETKFFEFAANGSEHKLFVPATHPVELVYPTYGATVTTDQPWGGIWINRGGWPPGSPQPLCCLGIEATNTPAEQPAGQWLAAGATFYGSVNVEIHLELCT